jgi:hypothetical protein
MSREDEETLRFIQDMPDDIRQLWFAWGNGAMSARRNTEAGLRREYEAKIKQSA